MLIDTDVIIWHMRGNLRATKVLDRLQDPAISAVTYMELVQGMSNKRELKTLRETLSGRGIEILPINEGISHKAMFLVEQHFHSHSLRLADALIGATAIEHGQTLLTANTKHYGVIKELTLEQFRPE
ncbi:MAG: type II toxin-antitoxin system VapC family toxin [Sulfuricaulis sp.]